MVREFRIYLISKKYAVNSHPNKTRFIRFGRFALRDWWKWQGKKPGTFDFLGFTHYCTKKKSNKGFTVGRKSIKQEAHEISIERDKNGAS